MSQCTIKLSVNVTNMQTAINFKSQGIAIYVKDWSDAPVQQICTCSQSSVCLLQGESITLTGSVRSNY